jgi:hypothetical protein
MDLNQVRDDNSQPSLIQQELVVPLCIAIIGTILYRAVLIWQRDWRGQHNRRRHRIQSWQSEHAQRADVGTQAESPSRELTSNNSAEKLRSILEKLGAQTWTRERQVRLNVKTNTISLYDTEDCKNIEPIPLRFDGMPVIPHNFPRASRYIQPPTLRTDPNLPNPDGLTDEQVTQLKDFFPPMKTVDFYYDREVVISFDTKSNLAKATENVGSNRFKAFECTFILITLPKKPRKSKRDWDIQEQAEQAEKCTGIVTPGSAIFNSRKESSTLGTFLSTMASSPASSFNVDFFTVYSQSFLRKKVMTEAPCFWAALLCVVIIGWTVGMNTKLLPLDLHRHTAAILFCVAILDVIQFFSLSKVYLSVSETGRRLID